MGTRWLELPAATRQARKPRKPRRTEEGAVSDSTKSKQYLHQASESGMRHCGSCFVVEGGGGKVDDGGGRRGFSWFSELVGEGGERRRIS